MVRKPVPPTENNTKNPQEDYNINGGRGNRYNGNGRSMNTDARNLHLPTLAIVGLIGFFVWITYIAITERARLDSKITELQSILNDFKRDRIIWCLKAQQKNKDWTCPSFPDRTIMLDK